MSSTALWVVQILLALAFSASGVMKITTSREQLGKRMTWANDFSAGTIKLIGGLEVLGAIGLILPTLTGILTILTPLAAVGLALTMIGAAWTHIRYKEYGGMAPSIVLLALTLFVAYGRFVVLPL
jgi:uncharacterized membrane protein YphA (DoxX/SURF4 family)